MVAECVGKVSNISLKFRWEIDNLRISCYNVGDYLKSPNFPADYAGSNTQWHLKLFPKNVKEGESDEPGLYLFANAEIKAKATFKLLRKTGGVALDRSIENTFGIMGGSGYGFSVPRDLILDYRSDRILSNDKMTIECEIAYLDYEIKYDKAADLEVKENQRINLLIPRLEDEYENLLNDSKFSDISLMAEGKTMKVHKCILAKSSSVFAAMFDAEMKEKQENTVEIADVKYDVLVEMIRFVYAGKVNNIDTLAGELAIAADKYALDGLKHTCEKTMRKNLSLDNVFQCLQFADRLRMKQLKKKAMIFMIENASDVSDKPEFASLSNDILREVFRCLRKKDIK